jgi:hypothetical protein
MTRASLALLAAAVCCACANGGASDETPPGAKTDSSTSTPIVDCKERFPVNGERCDTTTTAPNAYCRARSCNEGCEDECFCRGTGRWECLLYCRDQLGCGSTPLCGVDCMDAAVAPDTATSDDATTAD